MPVSTLIAVLVFLGGAVLLAVGYVLKVVREALGELAREEVKAAIPEIALGLVRRAAADVDGDEHAIVEDWERRLEEARGRPLVMLAIAIGIYKERKVLAAEAAEPSLEYSPTAKAARPSGFRSGVGGVAVRLTVAVNALRRAWQSRDWLTALVGVLGVELAGMALAFAQGVIPEFTVSLSAVAFFVSGVVWAIRALVRISRSR